MEIPIRTADLYEDIGIIELVEDGRSATEIEIRNPVDREYPATSATEIQEAERLAGRVFEIGNDEE